MKTALKKLKDTSEAAAVEAAGMRSEAAVIREKAAGVVGVAEATDALERSDAELALLQGNPTCESLLGAKIVSKGWKVADLMGKWDKDGDGSVSKDEFRVNVSAMGVQSSVAEVDALFDQYDDDGGGSLDLNELKPTLKKLIDAAQIRKAQVDEAVKAQVVVRKAAFKAQRELAEARAAEARAAKAAEEAAAKAAEEARLAEEERKRQEAEARAAKAAAKAAEKAEYEAKIAARRKAQKEGLDAPALDAKSEWKAAGLAVILGNKMKK